MASYRYLELIGNVILREDLVEDGETGRRRRKHTWILQVTHNGRVYDIDDESGFLVLHIDDPNAYFWSPSYDLSELPDGQVFTFAKNAVPTFALRAAFNRLDHKYNYIGRVLTTSQQRLRFYANAWISFEDNSGCVAHSFGRIGRSQRLLFVPYRGIEVGVDCFETLCLKASPASLKTLCRSVVRSNLNYCQVRNATPQKCSCSISSSDDTNNCVLLS